MRVPKIVQQNQDKHTEEELELQKKAIRAQRDKTISDEEANSIINKYNSIEHSVRLVRRVL